MYVYIPKRVSPPADRFFTARSEDGCVRFMIFTYARLDSELGLGVAQTHARPSARRFAQQPSAAAPPPTSPRSQQFVQRCAATNHRCRFVRPPQPGVSCPAVTHL